MSLSKNQLKLITSLRQKKYRIKHNFFIAEGTKVVNEFLTAKLKLKVLFCVDDAEYKFVENVVQISDSELKKISSLKSPNNVLAIFEIPLNTSISNEGLILALDEVNDPGNMGTIIRLCDWFGIEQLICSESTVDCFNPKVVQATMGSLSRVKINYVNLVDYLSNSKLPKYAAVMRGDSVYKANLAQNAILVVGNEANGISDEVLSELTHFVTIPRFGKLQQTESLNVATATAILLSEFKRLN